MLDSPMLPLESGEAAIGHNSSDPVAKREAFVERVSAFLRGLDVWTQRKTVDADTAPRLRDFIAGLKKLAKEADEARKAEKKPHDDAAKAVQAAWAPIADKIDAALKSAEPILAAFLREEQRKADEAKAEAARKAREAEAAAAAARADAAAAATESARIEAEARAAELAKAAKAENRAAKAGPTRVESATGLANRAGLREVRSARIIDLARAVFHYRDHPDMADLILRLANADIRASKGEAIEIPGIAIDVEQKLAG